MKIYRGSGSTEELTDEKSPSEYIEEWQPGQRINLDATKNKKSERSTCISLILDEEDVTELSAALLNSYKKDTIRMKDEINELHVKLSIRANQLQFMEDGFFKIKYFIDTYEKESKSKLLEAINQITNYYLTDDEANLPNLGWIDLSELPDKRSLEQQKNLECIRESWSKIEPSLS